LEESALAIRVSLAVPPVLLLVVAAACRAAPAPSSRAVEAYERTSRLLDSGQNERVISLLQNKLKENPYSITAADGLLEAKDRRCAYDAGLDWLSAVQSRAGGGASVASSRFLEAHRLRRERDFGAAAVGFLAAAETSLAAGDTLSAALCLGRAARSFVAARDREGAAETSKSYRSLVSRIDGSDRLDAEAALLEAEAANLGDRLEVADSLYRRALSASERGGYRWIQSHAFTGLGRLDEKRQYFQEAVDDYRRALVAARALGATAQTAKLLTDLAQSETRAGELGSARAHFDESMELVRSCGAEWVLGYVYYGLGALEEAEGNNDAATTYFHESVDQHHRNGNNWSEMGARLRLAYRYMGAGAYAEAVDQCRLCLDHYEISGSLYGKGWALAGLALANHRLGNLKLARDYYTRTLEVRRRLGDRRGEAWCLNSLGMASDLQGDYRQALDFEHQAMEIYEALEDARGVGSVLFSMGSVYFYLGNLSTSMEHYERAYAIAKESGDFELLENVVSGIASVYHAADRTDLAEKFYLEHLAMTRKSGIGSNVVWSLNNLASLYVQMGRPQKARAYVEEALSLLPGKGMDHLRSRALYLYGKTVATDREAIAYTERALELAERNGLKELQWKYLTDLGEYYRAVGDTDRARDLQERAILQVESLRRGVGSDELRRHMLRPAMAPYERMVEMILEEKKETHATGEAFAYAERAKAQIFASLLKEALERIQEDGDEVQTARKDLVSRLSYVQSRLQDPALEEADKRGLIDEMTRIERDLLLEELRLADSRNDYAASFYPSKSDQTAIAETIRPNERMLSYFLGRDASYLFVSSGAGVEVFVLPKRAAIEEKVGFYIRLLRQLAGKTADLPASVFDDASEELFDVLVGPAAGILEPGETLVLLPDGILNRLPFSLLRHGDAYLIEMHPIFYAPSLQSLYYLRRREARRNEEGGGKELDVIAVGSRGGGQGGNRPGRVYPLTDIPVEELPLADEEARSVAAMFEKSLVLVGRDATERSFKNAPLGAANIIHIAAHSYVDNEDVRRSFIVLNPETEGTGGGVGGIEDDLLQWHEVAGLRTDAALVTLSACRTAGGVLAYGEGITGLTQAFLYAGGNCVLASFIDVPDRFAGRFMAAFYRHLKSGQSGAEALRATQLEAADWRYASHGPALWGSFALIGDGDFLLSPQ
jgi:CHAT domain-containing protein